jgi:outer membrane lipoprotein-sorting protein
MKKLLTAMAGILLVTSINAQTLEEIVKKYSAANKHDQISALSTIKITGKMSMMGMEMPMELWMKKPDKIKSVTDFNGQKMVSAFDGKKGYSINPMTGSTDPVEMTPEQIKQTQNNNLFQDYLTSYLEEGKLTLVGDDNVNGKPAFKLEARLEGDNKLDLFIDKDTYLLLKTSTEINQGGMNMTADSYMTDYTDNDGVFLPMKTTTSANGMEFTITFDKVEVNVPMADSIFTLKQ